MTTLKERVEALEENAHQPREVYSRYDIRVIAKEAATDVNYLERKDRREAFWGWVQYGAERVMFLVLGAALGIGLQGVFR